MGVKLSRRVKEAWSYLQSEPSPIVTSTFNEVFITQAPLQYRMFLQSLKPYINKATATDNSFSQNEALAVLNVARKIVLGERPFFEGEDGITAFLNDVWAKKVNFRAFLGTVVNDLLVSGTTVLKLSINERGQIFPKSYRADRVLFTTDYQDDIVDAFFFCGAFGVKVNEVTSNYYYLIERRYFNEKEEAVTLYKVLIGTDVGGQPTISNIFSNGIAFNNLPPQVKKELQKIGVIDLNKEIKLPFSEGLGCYLIKLTASNAVAPEIPYGVPLLYGSLPVLHSIDLLTAKNDVDIEFSRAMELTPAEYVKVEGRFAPTGDKPLAPDEVDGMLRRAYAMGQQASRPVEDDDLFVGILPPKADGTFDPPQFIQPDLMAEANRYALETLETKLAIVCGFSPTSIFPNLADNSPKTATEVTAEENLTRATIHDIHEQIIPQIEKLAQEVLRQEGEEMGKQLIAFKMSDYIGNKLQADENTRLNYQAGLLPRKKAMQNLNGTTTKETLDDLQDILDEEKEKRQTELENLGLGEYNDSDYYNEGASVEEQRTENEGGSDSDRGSEDNNPPVGNQLQFIKQT